jgi:hypothetical protein
MDHCGSGLRSVARRARPLERIVIALVAAFACPAAAPAQQDSASTRRDWPCQQILVGRISAAAVWSGPPVDNVAWKSDPAVAALAAQLAARRTPLEEAERLVVEFAQAQGANKSGKLTAVFAGAFETLNDERTQVIEGLLRFGAKQRELAETIRAERPESQTNSSPAAANRAQQVPDAAAQKLEWDMRLFDERRQSLAFVCESPTLIEQRLFALAKMIERHLQ